VATFPVEIAPELDSPDLNADVRFGGEVIPAKNYISVLFNFFFQGWFKVIKLLLNPHNSIDIYLNRHYVLSLHEVRSTYF
jgi:hypothetical protein